MNVHTISLLFALLRDTVCGKRLNDSEKALFSPDLLPELLEISEKQDLSHLVAYAVSQNGLADPSQKDSLDKQVMMSVFRYSRLNRDYTKLCNALETAQIPFLPLKGSVLREDYPEPWMRTSCDIDILVPLADVDRAAAFLIDTLQYTYAQKTAHDISLFTPQKNHIELHFSLIEEGRANAACSVLEKVWENAQLCQNWGYRYELSDEMFYFYHVAHMAKHFEYGGCGIRPFLDLWILDHQKNADLQKRDALLEQGNLLQFCKTARMLSGVWFNQEQHDPVTLQMESFILRGNLYGTRENFVTIQQQKEGGQLQYSLSRIFMPYQKLKYQYPILQKHKWLTPLIQVVRWFRIIFHGRSKLLIREFQYNSQISDEEASSMQSFLKNIGL